MRELADLAEEDPLLGAADRYNTLRRFAPELIDALEFTAARSNDPVLSALRLLRDLNRSGRRNVPPDAPMPFRNRDRGAPCGATPPTPPGIRVRTTAVRRIKRPPAYPWEPAQDP